MKFICRDCGYEIPDDMEFCPRCGCLREKSTPVDDSTGFPLNVCPQCGAARSLTDEFCGACGAKLPSLSTYRPYIRPKLRKNGALALMLALIPGFFNVFGLGHLVLRQWSRGAMFLAMSVLVWYLTDWKLYTDDLFVTMIHILVYFYQAMDIFRVVYSPED